MGERRGEERSALDLMIAEANEGRLAAQLLFFWLIFSTPDRRNLKTSSSHGQIGLHLVL